MFPYFFIYYKYLFIYSITYLSINLITFSDFISIPLKAGESDLSDLVASEPAEPDVRPLSRETGMKKSGVWRPFVCRSDFCVISRSLMGDVILSMGSGRESGTVPDRGLKTKTEVNICFHFSIGCVSDCSEKKYSP